MCSHSGCRLLHLELAAGQDHFGNGLAGIYLINFVFCFVKLLFLTVTHPRGADTMYMCSTDHQQPVPSAEGYCRTATVSTACCVAVLPQVRSC
jgi:hypothetical protein